MKFCSKCGKEVKDEAVVCPNCGCSLGGNTPVGSAYNPDDKANIGLVVLSALFPIAGVILWPVKHSKTPKAARTYGITGIVAWVAYVLIMSMLS